MRVRGWVKTFLVREQHALFRQLPIDGQVVVDGETLPTPYHVDDGSLAALNGTVDAAVAAHALRGEPFKPVLDAAGRALAIIWLGDFTSASLAAHREVQIGLVAVRQPTKPIPSGPFAVQRALFAVPGVVNVCHGLWNDTRRVVSYNREHLLLNVKLATIDLVRDANAWRVDAQDSDGQPILTATFGTAEPATGAAGVAMLKQLGLRASIRMLSSRTARAQVANTARDGVEGGQLALTLTAGDRQGIREANSSDQLIIKHPNFATLDFRLGSLLIIDGLRFAYGRPVPAASP